MEFRNSSGSRENLSGTITSLVFGLAGANVTSPATPFMSPFDPKCCRSLLRSALVLAALILSACTTASKPLQYTSMPEISHGERPEAQGNKLQALQYEELVARGNRYLAEKNTGLARLHYRIAIQKKNDSATAYAGLGETLALDGENKAAHQTFDKALAMDGKNRQALLATAKLYEKERNFAQAEIFFNRALAIYADDPEILTELAVSYGHNGQPGKAGKLLAMVVAEKPGDPAAYNNLGFNYLLLEKYPEAIETLQTALSFNPDDHRTRNNLAAAYALNNNFQKAFDLLNQTEGAAAAYNDLGYFYMKMGKNNSARTSFEKALELNPKLYTRAQENLRRLDEGF